MVVGESRVTDFGLYRLGSIADAKRPFVRPPVYAACVLISMLAGGCAVGPKYKAPSVTVSPFHGTSLVDARKAGLASTRIEESFVTPATRINRGRTEVSTRIASAIVACCSGDGLPLICASFRAAK